MGTQASPVCEAGVLFSWPCRRRAILRGYGKTERADVEASRHRREQDTSRNRHKSRREDGRRLGPHAASEHRQEALKTSVPMEAVNADGRFPGLPNDGPSRPSFQPVDVVLCHRPSVGPAGADDDERRRW